MLSPLFCRLAPPHLVLGCSRSLVGVDTESSEVVQETSHPFFFYPSTQLAPPTQFLGHHPLRQSRVLHARHKFREQDPPPAHNRLHALTPRFHERVQTENWMVGAVVLSPTDAAIQEAVVGSDSVACHSGTRTGSK